MPANVSDNLKVSPQPEQGKAMVMSVGLTPELPLSANDDAAARQLLTG
jgi:hypothetical protein